MGPNVCSICVSTLYWSVNKKRNSCTLVWKKKKTSGKPYCWWQFSCCSLLPAPLPMIYSIYFIYLKYTLVYPIRFSVLKPKSEKLNLLGIYCQCLWIYCPVSTSTVSGHQVASATRLSPWNYWRPPHTTTLVRLSYLYFLFICILEIHGWQWLHFFFCLIPGLNWAHVYISPWVQFFKSSSGPDWMVWRAVFGLWASSWRSLLYSVL